MPQRATKALDEDMIKVKIAWILEI